jgi:hypothetical protein
VLAGIAPSSRLEAVKEAVGIMIRRGCLKELRDEIASAYLDRRAPAPGSRSASTFG